MEKIDFIFEITKKIITEQQYFKITTKDGKTAVYKRKKNILIREANDSSLKKRCVAEIQMNINYFDKKISLKKLVGELMFALEISPGFIKDEEKFMPPRHCIPLDNGEYSFDSNEFKKDDGRTLRFNRLNASYDARYINDPLPVLFDRIIRNGISNPQLSQEDNDKRYNSFLDCIAYTFFPENPLRKFFFIVGAPHSGKTTLCRVMRNIFGPYACSLEIHSLLKQSRSSPEARPDLYGIAKKLWIDVSELDKGKIQTRLVKNLSGNDPIITRKLHSNEMQEEILNGKFFIVCNNYPQFDDRNDEALQERLVVFDWHNSVSEQDTIYDLAEILNSEENRSHIATFFINRIAQRYNNSKISIEIHPSFIFRPELSYDNTELELRNFFDKCLLCIGSDKWKFHPFCSNHIETCRTDIYSAYIYYHTNILNKPQTTIVKMKGFKESLNNYLQQFPQVQEIRVTNGYFYRGVVLAPKVVNFQPRIPMYGNYGKMKQLSSPMFC